MSVSRRPAAYRFSPMTDVDANNLVTFAGNRRCHAGAKLAQTDNRNSMTHSRGILTPEPGGKRQKSCHMMTATGPQEELSSAYRSRKRFVIG